MNSKVNTITNKETAILLRRVAVAYEINNESFFRINAYRKAADEIEKYPIELSTMYPYDTLTEINGIGPSMKEYLKELYTTGKVAHFTELFDTLPSGMFTLMQLRGVGVKTAYNLALHINMHANATDATILSLLEKDINNNSLLGIKGMSEKRIEDINSALQGYKKGAVKKRRLLLDEAEIIIESLKNYLSKNALITRFAVVGSYRRKKDTIGDIDIALITNDISASNTYIKAYSQIKQITDEGNQGISCILKNDVQVNIRYAKKQNWGTMMQYFTGSKYYNIALRTYVRSKFISLSEYGCVSTRAPQKEMKMFADEKSLYKYLSLSFIPSELRENTGELDAAKNGLLPLLVNLNDVKGDLHIHSDFEYPSSHDRGSSSLKELIEQAQKFGYHYIGLADHNPKKSLSPHEIDLLIGRRNQMIKSFMNTVNNQKKLGVQDRTIKVYKLMEVDIQPDGQLALPKSSYQYLDALIVSIHSVFSQNKFITTNRILRALSHPKVKILGHPTGRLLNKRESIQADWNSIFKFCKTKNIALEINANPHRLDLPDKLIKQAKAHGNKFIINTDSHHVSQMHYMRYGVYTARRGWLSKNDILNCQPSLNIEKWLS